MKEENFIPKIASVVRTKHLNEEENAYALSKVDINLMENEQDAMDTSILWNPRDENILNKELIDRSFKEKQKTIDKCNVSNKS